jgi:lipoprotein-releasing system permease protein
MPWYFYLALKQLFPTGKRLTFFTFISITGVAAGVWLLVATTGVMGGFGNKYRTMTVDTQGEIQVIAPGLIDRPDEFAPRLLKVPGVVAATPVAAGKVMLEYGAKRTFPDIQGIDVETAEKVIPIRKYIVVGSIDDLDDDTVILTAGLARSLGAGIGSKVIVFTPLALEKQKADEALLPTELRVVGILEFGHQQLDSSAMIVTLRRMQDLYGLGQSVHGFNLKLAPGADVIDTARRINTALPASSGAEARTWMEANEAFLFALQMEKTMVTLITSFVVLIAMFLVTALLLITVVRKTREIGLLGALGGLPRQTAACFCLQGFLVGTFGTLVGLAAGFLTLKNIDVIFHFLGRITGSWENLVAIYQFSQVPAHITLGEVCGISAYAIVMATLAGLISAWRAAKLTPVEAMRTE